MAKPLIEAIADMREEDATRLAMEMLDQGVSPLEVLDTCREAMVVVGKRFEAGDCFVPELILAGEMLRQISDLVRPRLTQAGGARKIGRVVIGTVQGDIHDIGKDIVSFMLDINGFEVRDLGVDVPAARFVEAIQDFGPQVVGLSGFLTLAYDPMKHTVAAIRELKQPVKIMIGGGQIDEQIRQYTGADAYGKDAMAAVSLATGWVGA